MSELKKMVIKTARARVNDCCGYCLTCPQARSDVSNTKDMLFYSCALPPLHSVTLQKRR